MPSPYLPNTDADRDEMLRAIGLTSVEELFADIPEEHRHPDLNLPAPLSELELLGEIQSMASVNANLSEYACFRGGGAYQHFIPAIVWNLANRSELATSYTPYQAEVSQGILQASYEFQSMICQLTGMEVANTGMYDGATALAEAALMACRLTKRTRVAALDTVSPRYVDVVRTYVEPQGITLTIGASAPPNEDTACVLVQSPNFYGSIEDLASLGQQAHAAGALMVVAANPISLGLFRPPAEYDADIVVGEGQPLGIPLSFGGPYLGLFACRREHIRQMPGRVAGRTVDTLGRTGYVLTLQTREQHIRRERATSNICTSETLVAIASTIYLAAMGKTGLRQVAELCYHKAHYAAERIASLPGYALALNRPFFNEFVIRCPRPPAEINQALHSRRIIGGLDVGHRFENGMLFCVTEMNSREQIDGLVAALEAVAT